MLEITYKELKEEHGLSNKQIQKFDRMAQKVLGNALKMIDACLKSKEDCDIKVTSCLVYVTMATELLEKIFLKRYQKLYQKRS